LSFPDKIREKDSNLNSQQTPVEQRKEGGVSHSLENSLLALPQRDEIEGLNIKSDKVEEKSFSTDMKTLFPIQVDGRSHFIRIEVASSFLHKYGTIDPNPPTIQ
jgi:hypothetical protein